MEQSAQNPTRPFLCLPPLATLAFLLVYRNSIDRDAKIHNLEEQPTPRHEAIVALLIPGQVQDDRVLVRLEDDVQDRGNLLLGASRRGVEQVRSERDQDRECLLDDSRQDVALLAESKPAKPRVNEQPEMYAEYGGRGEGEERTHRNARTISSTTTVPAPTSRMLLLARSALAPSSRSGHFSGKSCEMSVLSVLAS